MTARRRVAPGCGRLAGSAGGLRARRRDRRRRSTAGCCTVASSVLNRSSRPGDDVQPAGVPGATAAQDRVDVARDARPTNRLGQSTEVATGVGRRCGCHSWCGTEAEDMVRDRRVELSSGRALPRRPDRVVGACRVACRKRLGPPRRRSRPPSWRSARALAAEVGVGLAVADRPKDVVGVRPRVGVAREPARGRVTPARRGRSALSRARWPPLVPGGRALPYGGSPSAAGRRLRSPRLAFPCCPGPWGPWGLPECRRKRGSWR